MNQSGNKILYAVLAIVVLLFVARIPFLVRPLLLLLTLVGIVVVFLYFKTLWGRKKAASPKQEEINQSIEEKLRYCEQHIAKIQTEKMEIESNMESLQIRLNSSTELSPKVRAESERLIRAFQQELDLRNTKIEFYESCKLKLQSLLHNFLFTKDLANKQQTLKKLRESNEGDIAAFEELKTSLEFEQTYLQTIDQLSLRMLDSNSLQDVQSLQLELEAITKEMKQL